MTLIESVGQMASLVNAVIDLLDSQEKQMRARRMYMETLQEIRRKIREERDAEVIDKLILELVAAIRNK